MGEEIKSALIFASHAFTETRNNMNATAQERIKMVKVLVLLPSRKFFWRKNVEVEEGQEDKHLRIYQRQVAAVFGPQAIVELV